MDGWMNGCAKHIYLLSTNYDTIVCFAYIQTYIHTSVVPSLYLLGLSFMVFFLGALLLCVLAGRPLCVCVACCCVSPAGGVIEGLDVSCRGV